MADSPTLALEELKLLHAIIARQESLRLTLRGWAIGLFSVFTASFLSPKISLPRFGYLAVVLGLCVLFLWLEVVHRVAENRAMTRAECVEGILRRSAEYDGPLIGQSLARPNSFREQLRAVDNVRIYLPYTVLAAGAIAVAYLVKA